MMLPILASIAICQPAQTFFTLHEVGESTHLIKWSLGPSPKRLSDVVLDLSLPRSATTNRWAEPKPRLINHVISPSGELIALELMLAQKSRITGPNDFGEGCCLFVSSTRTGQRLFEEDMRSDVVCGLSWFGEKLHFKTIAYSRMKFFMSTIGVSDVEHWGAPVSDLFELSSFQNSPRKKLLTSGSSNSIDLYDPKRVSRAVRARLSLYKLLSPSSAAETVEILSAEISAGGYLSVTDPSADAVSEDGEVAAACIRIFELRDKFEATWEIWRVDADHPKEIGKLVFGKVDQSYDASIRGQYLLLMPHDQDRTVLYDLRTLKPVGSVPGRPAGK